MAKPPLATQTQERKPGSAQAAGKGRMVQSSQVDGKVGMTGKMR